LQNLVRVHSTANGDPRSVILATIKCATKNINLVMYTFTDKGIAIALANANKRGVMVFVLVDRDQSKLKQMPECLTILSDAGVQVCD
jgi:phosphatidylserine/phosphatidylglycerophosphate/cardiolipin synthase-like enzyme